jgi:hypothetical protein
MVAHAVHGTDDKSRGVPVRGVRSDTHSKPSSCAQAGQGAHAGGCDGLLDTLNSVVWQIGQTASKCLVAADREDTSTAAAAAVRILSRHTRALHHRGLDPKCTKTSTWCVDKSHVVRLSLRQSAMGHSSSSLCRASAA